MAGDMGTTIGGANVRIMPNTQRFKAELKSALEKIEQSVKATIGLDADDDGFKASVQNAVQAAESAVESIDVGVDVDAAEIVRETKSAAERASSDAIIKPEIDVDGAGFVAKVKALTAAASKSAKVHATISLSTAAFTAELAAAKVAMDMFGGSVASTVVRSFPGFIGGLSAATVAVGGLAPSLAAVGAAAASAVGPMVALGGALAPGAITGAALAVGTLKTAFTGLGDAINAEDLDAFNEAVAGMPPAMQAAAGALRELKTEFSGIGSSIQQAFWEPLSNLSQVSVLVEPIHAAMVTVAESFGEAAARLVDFTTQGTGLSAMSTLLSSAASAGSGMATALGSVLRGLVAVGAAAAPVLDDLNARIIAAADSWANRMVAGFESGNLTQYFQNAATAAGQFFDMLGQVGGIIGGVFAAMSAAGSPVAGMLGQMVADTNAWVNSAQGMTTLVGFFTQMQGAVQALSPILGDLARIIVETIAPTIAQFVQNLAPGLQTFIQSMGEALQILAPYVADLGTKLGEILQFVSPLLPILAQLAPVLVPLAAGFMAVSTAVKAASVAMKATSLVMTLFTNPIAAIIAIVAVLAIQIVRHWDEIKAKTQELWQRFKEILTNLRDDALRIVGNLILGAVGKFEELRDGALRAVGRLIMGAVERFTNLRDSVTNIASTLWQRVTTAFQNGVNSAISWVASLPGRVLSALGDMGSFLYNSGRALIQGFINGIGSMFSYIAQTAKNAVQTARNFFPFSPAKKGPFSGRGWVLYSGRSIGEAFAQGIEDTTGDAAAASGRMMQATADNLNGYKAGAGRFGVSAQMNMGAGGADFSVKIGTVVAADETRPLQEVQRMQRMAMIKGGRL